MYLCLFFARRACVYRMKKCRALAVIFAVLVCLSLFTASVGAVICSPASDSSVLSKINTKTVPCDGFTLEYDVYNSPGYDPKDDTKASTVVLCFAEEGERFSEIFSLLLSDDADNHYKDYVYTAVNLRLPAGQKWVDTDEESGYFDAKKDPTAAMAAIPGIVADIMAFGFPADKTVVAGVNSGGTAAWYFSSHNTKTVSHVLTVGACVDPDSAMSIQNASIRAYAYVGKLDDSHSEAHASLQSQFITNGYDGFTLNELQCDREKTVDLALSEEDSPSVTDWLVKNSYQTQFFKIVSSAEGKGGTITETQQVFYGNSAAFYITLENDYFIQNLYVNGKDAPLTELVSVSENKFCYTFNNVTSAGSIAVTFASKGYGFFDADNLLLLCTVLAAVFVVAAVATFAVSKYASSKRA